MNAFDWHWTFGPYYQAGWNTSVFGTPLIEKHWLQHARVDEIGKWCPVDVTVEARNYNWRSGWWRVTDEDIERLREMMSE